MIQKWDSVILLEVKSETNLKAKSLTSFMEIYKPKKAICVSLSDFKCHGSLYDIPLYLKYVYLIGGSDISDRNMQTVH